MTFRVDQIDHVELTVPDRFEAAHWYSKTLGLNILSQFQFWADDSCGPLMIGTANAETKLALFNGTPTGSRRNTGFHLLAFRTNGENFLAFLSNLNSLKILNQEETPVTRSDVVDHQKSWSIYFCDPWKNQLELTTYDYEKVRSSFIDD